MSSAFSFTPYSIAALYQSYPWTRDSCQPPFFLFDNIVRLSSQARLGDEEYLSHVIVLTRGLIGSVDWISHSLVQRERQKIFNWLLREILLAEPRVLRRLWIHV